MARRRTGRLYRGRGTRARELRSFQERYGARRGRRVYGAVVGKTARERAARRPRHTLRERVKPHWSESSEGKRYRVRGHEAIIVAHPHSRGEHSGRCTRACRQGRVGHPHRHRSR